MEGRMNDGIMARSKSFGKLVQMKTLHLLDTIRYSDFKMLLATDNHVFGSNKTGRVVEYMTLYCV